MHESIDEIISKIQNSVKHLPKDQNYVIDVIEEINEPYLGVISIEGKRGITEVIRFTLASHPVHGQPPAHTTIVKLSSISQLIPIVHHLDTTLNGAGANRHGIEKHSYTKKAKLVALLGA